MSGRKRALLRMNERDRRKLAKIESRLGKVDLDFTALEIKIDEMRSKTKQQIDTQRYERDLALEKSVSHLDYRIREIEASTQLSLQTEIETIQDLVTKSGNQYYDLTGQINHNSESIMNSINQLNLDFGNQLSWLNLEIQGLSNNSQQQQEIAWQNLNYAQEIYANLNLTSTDHNQYFNESKQISMLITTGWMNYQNEIYQAAIVSGQQAIIQLADLRFKIEEENFKFNTIKLIALEETMKVLELAFDSQYVNAIDLDGNTLDITINVDFWTGGLINQAIQTLSLIQNKLTDPKLNLDVSSIEELVTQTLPAWEKALCEYVSNARVQVIASQTRFEVAKTVVYALSEQGFEVENGSFESGDLRHPYHIILENLEGSQVHVSVSDDQNDPLNYLLDIDSLDSEFRSETELRQRAKVLLESVESVGIKVGQIYQADPPRTNIIKETSPVKYTADHKKRNK